jgi:hypothetical protein
VIGPRQLTSRTLRALNLDPERAAANAAPSAAQRRRDRADQLAAILRRYNNTRAAGWTSARRDP